MKGQADAPDHGEPVDMQDAPVSSIAAANLLDKKQRQRLKAEGIELFNQKPKKGIALLQSHGLVSHDPVEVAHFLKQTAGLDYAMMGDFLSDPSDSCKQVGLPFLVIKRGTCLTLVRSMNLFVRVSSVAAEM
jgi:Sec7 domain